MANIIRTLLCQLNAEETDLWSSIVNRDLRVPLNVDSELRMPKQYLDKLVKEMKISQKEKEKMRGAIDCLPPNLPKPTAPPPPLLYPEATNVWSPSTAEEDIPDLQPKYAQDFVIHALKDRHQEKQLIGPHAESLDQQGYSDLHTSGAH